MSASQTNNALHPSRQPDAGGALSSRRRRPRPCNPSNNIKGGEFSGGVGPGGKINASQAHAGKQIYQTKDTQKSAPVTTDNNTNITLNLLAWDGHNGLAQISPTNTSNETKSPLQALLLPNLPLENKSQAPPQPIEKVISNKDAENLRLAEENKHLKDSLAKLERNKEYLEGELKTKLSQERERLYLERARIYQERAQLLRKNSIGDIAMETETNKALKRENDCLTVENQKLRARQNGFREVSDQTRERRRLYSQLKAKLKDSQCQVNDRTDEWNKAGANLRKAEETLHKATRAKDRKMCKETQASVNKLDEEKRKAKLELEEAQQEADDLQDEVDTLGAKIDIQEDSDFEYSDPADSQHATQDSPPGLSEDRSSWPSRSPTPSPPELTLLADRLSKVTSTLPDTLHSDGAWAKSVQPPHPTKIKLGRNSNRNNPRHHQRT